MNRDLLIAIGTEIPSTVTVPLSMGALHSRTNSEPHDSWVEDAILAHSQGRRPVLVGDISNPEMLLASLMRAKTERPQIRFALLLHFSQVLQTPLSDTLRSQFDEVFVAVDRAISSAEAHLVRMSVRPRWLLIPRVGLDWKEILTGRLLPERRGIATVLSPPENSPWSREGPFLSADELLIHIQEFQDEHPLIEVRPPPHEWFVPSEIAPWHDHSRDRQLAAVVKTTEEQIPPSVSFVIPFHWQNQSSAMGDLTVCLQSCLRVVDYVYAQSEMVTVEYIICVDRDFDAATIDPDTLKKSLDPRVWRSLTVVECQRKNSADDWRAGFIRNVGASYSRVGSGGLLVFVDSDVEIVDPAIVANEIIEGKNSLVFSRVRSEKLPVGEKPLSQENQPFQVASSRLMIVRRSLFENLGGFANAFRTYGCEDNFLVWQTTEILRKGLPVSFAAFPFATTRDLKTTSDQKDLLEKMIRLRNAADLFYRMTFDPRVHRHFFVSLGQAAAFRFFFKKMACRKNLRWLMGPVVFALTLFETENRGAYLSGFWDIIKWKAKRPLLWASSEAWRVGQAKHVAKKHSWRIPHVFQTAFHLLRHAVAVVLIFFQRILIKVRATKFGWNVFGWRFVVGSQKAWGALLRISSVHFLYPILHVIKQIPWWIKVLLVRIWGLARQAWGGVKFTVGWLHKFFVDWIWVPPYHLTRLYGWKILATLTTPFRYVRGNFWQVRLLAKKLRGELWRIPVLWNRFLGYLWFVPVGFQRIRERILQTIRLLKEKLRGTP